MVRFGVPPFLDCSGDGDRRCNAVHARIRGRRHRSIDEIYRSVKPFRGKLIGLPRPEARRLIEIHRQEVKDLYAALWDEYISENPQLLDVLCDASGLIDRTADPRQPSGAEELWRIRFEVLSAERRSSEP
jgi:hypothetical protein